VTPFARPIPLQEGTHYVTLLHPSAPVEKRTVSIARGEIRTLDAVMNIPASARPGDHPAAADDAGVEEAASDKSPAQKENKR